MLARITKNRPGLANLSNQQQGLGARGGEVPTEPQRPVRAES